jgi:predicted lipoprotein with Yx(FWY)xxD motif
MFRSTLVRRAAVLACAAVPALLAPPAMAAMGGSPVKVVKHADLGRVLFSSTNRALYYWTPERKTHKVRCTGACARAWPPVLVAAGAKVPHMVAGVHGELATIRRADGKRQLTLDGVPLYTYAHERPGQLLCNDVDGWFAVPAKGLA